MSDELQDIAGSNSFCVVVGDQGSGKSSLINSLVGKDVLPWGSDFCTRRPLVLQAVQRKSQRRSDESEEEYGEFTHLPGQRFSDFSDIWREIKAETDRETGENKGVSDKQIRLKIFSPNVIDITLVDLPGIPKVSIGDQPSDIEARIKTMILPYIKPPSCLILAVTPANSNLANSYALQMAKAADPDGNRTIGVITKLDVLDRGTDACDALLGKVIPLKLGYVGVVNRCPAFSSNTSIKDASVEETFFRNCRVYDDLADRCGVPQLTEKLKETLCFIDYGELYGTTAIALKCQDGYMLSIDSRMSNESLITRTNCTSKALEVDDTMLKAFCVSDTVMGLMIGNKRRSFEIKDKLIKSCASKVSISEVVECASKIYDEHCNVETEYGQKKLNKDAYKSKAVATILCGSDSMNGSQCHLSWMIFNGEEVVLGKGKDIPLLALGSGGRLVYDKDKTIRDGKAHSISDELNTFYLRRLGFHASFYDKQTGGPNYIYKMIDGKWAPGEKSNIFEDYLDFYQDCRPEATLFIVFPCDGGGGNVKGSDLIEHIEKSLFGRGGERKVDIECAHRVCEIHVEGGGVYFNRLVCGSPALAKEIRDKLKKMDESSVLNPKIKPILKPFRHGMKIWVKGNDGKKEAVCLYIERASKELVHHLKNAYENV